MKKPQLYLILSVFAVLFTFVTGLGFIFSTILLFMMSSEKQKMLQNGAYPELNADLDTLKRARIICILNIVLGILIWIFLIVCLLIFGFAMLDGSLWRGVYQH